MLSSVSIRPSAVVPYGALVSQFHAEPHGKLYCLHGDALAFRVALSAASQAILRGMTVALVDGANRFDAYFIAEFARHVARRGGPPPETLLNRIFVSRAFTCYQMEAVVTERLPKFLDRTGSRIAVLFGPLDTFYDDQAPFFEVKAGVGRMIVTLQRLREERVSVLVASQDVRLASNERSGLFPRLAAAMDRVYTVEQQEGKLLMQAQVAPATAPLPKETRENRGRTEHAAPLRIPQRSVVHR
jgi:hypothetical protein